MKKLFLTGATVIVLSMAAMAQTPAPAKPTPTPAKMKSTAVAKTSMPKTDAEIQTCTQDKLASTKLKDDGITVMVNGGEATLTGMVKIGGHKGNATQFAKHCGATKVSNNITAQSTPKMKMTKPANGDAQMTPKKP